MKKKKCLVDKIDDSFYIEVTCDSAHGYRVDAIAKADCSR